MLAVLATQEGSSRSLRPHVRWALEHGATPAELDALACLVAAYAGFPRASVALEAIRDELRLAGVPPDPSGDEPGWSYVETPDGVRLRICDRGRGGHTFVLVHGWKQSHRLFDPAIARLSERHRVVAFDHRGMGESDAWLPLRLRRAGGRPGIRPRRARPRRRDAGGLVDGLHRQPRLHELGRGPRGPARAHERPSPPDARARFPYGLEPERIDGYIDDLARTWPLNERAFAAESLREPDAERVDWLVRIALPDSSSTSRSGWSGAGPARPARGRGAARRPRARRVRPARGLVAARARGLDAIAAPAG